MREDVEQKRSIYIAVIHSAEKHHIVASESELLIGDAISVECLGYGKRLVGRVISVIETVAGSPFHLWANAATNNELAERNVVDVFRKMKSRSQDCLGVLDGSYSLTRKGKDVCGGTFQTISELSELIRKFGRDAQISVSIDLD